MARLAGKVGIVTGCSPNIGAALALALAEEGAAVACVDLNPTYAKKCAEVIEQAGGRALALVCDVTAEDQVVATVDRVRGELGGVDVLLNGVALRIGKGVVDTSLAEFRQQLDVTVCSAFLFTKYVARAMIEQGRGGSIITLISTEGHQGYPGSVGYGTAKSGLLNFTRAVAMELAEHRIRVNSLSPTSTDPSEGIDRAREWGLEWQAHSEVRGPGFPPGNSGVPLGQRPSPRHYGRAAVFLASDDAEMITGFDLRVDAGTVAKYWRWMPGY
jgi:NAD(P)-dependent dehydrogenase (short-subunit alcohol dehydrogenase family)